MGTTLLYPTKVFDLHAIGCHNFLLDYLLEIYPFDDFLLSKEVVQYP
jgi:hypothetical protein